MQVGAVGYPTYVYNTNRLSARSLGRVKAVPQDALDSSVGYGETENPLPLGASKDFAGIIASQMAEGRLHAARLMKEQEA